LSSSRPSAKAVAARQATLGLRDFLNGYKALLEYALREEGLTLPQLRLLKAVSDQQSEVSSATIARKCQITPQTLQTMLTRAVREGWIVRGTSARNHRILTASLTPKGEALRKRGEVMAAQIESKLWKGISLDILETFNQTLNKGNANLQAELSLVKHL
jgi:MarR family transcriptional regulator, organic hydroperoxide resistance regulator